MNEEDGYAYYYNRVEPIVETTDSEEVIAKFKEEMEGIQKVLFYYGEHDPYLSEELLSEAEESGMTYFEFLDYVYEQTGKTYDEIVDRSFEFHPL